MNRGQLRERASIFDLQPLEVRRFFTTANLSGGTLTITGTNSAETITVNKNTSNRITINGVTNTFAAGSVARMVINAQNGIPSKGLLQVIPPTFASYHVSGTSENIYNPVANIVAACNYAAAKYGSMDNVDSAY